MTFVTVNLQVFELFKSREKDMLDIITTTDLTVNMVCHCVSCPAKPPSTISHLINTKASMLQELRVAFDERAEDMAQSYIDVLEQKARSDHHPVPKRLFLLGFFFFFQNF